MKIVKIRTKVTASKGKFQVQVKTKVITDEILMRHVN
jgi:hypothetical protein